MECSLASAENTSIDARDLVKALTREVEADELTDVLWVESERDDGSDYSLGNLSVCKRSVDCVCDTQTDSTTECARGDGKSRSGTDEERRSRVLNPNHDQDQNGGETQTTDAVECKTKLSISTSKCKTDNRSTEGEEADKDRPLDISELGDVDGKEGRDDGDDHEEWQEVGVGLDGARLLPDAVDLRWVDVVHEVEKGTLNSNEDHAEGEVASVLEQAVVQETSLGSLPFCNIYIRACKTSMRIGRTIDQADDEEETTDNDRDDGVSLVSPAIVGVSTPGEAHQEGNEGTQKQNVTNPVESLELLAKRLLAGGGTRRGLQDDVVSKVSKSGKDSTYEVECCDADDDEALEDELDAEDPSPAVHGIGSRRSTDGKKSNER